MNEIFPEIIPKLFCKNILLMQFSVWVVWRGHWLVAAGLVFIHWVLTLTRILNILTWTSRAISHNMLPAEEKLGNYHHKNTAWLARRHLMINLYFSTEYEYLRTAGLIVTRGVSQQSVTESPSLSSDPTNPSPVSVESHAAAAAGEINF